MPWSSCSGATTGPLVPWQQLQMPALLGCKHLGPLLKVSPETARTSGPGGFHHAPESCAVLGLAGLCTQQTSSPSRIPGSVQMCHIHVCAISDGHAGYLLSSSQNSAGSAAHCSLSGHGPVQYPPPFSGKLFKLWCFHSAHNVLLHKTNRKRKKQHFFSLFSHCKLTRHTLLNISLPNVAS